MKVQRYIHYSQYGDTIYTLATLYERKEEILTEEEKEYLSKFIEPFRTRVTYIMKRENLRHNEYNFIKIIVKSISELTEFETIVFPYFKNKSMYKGMELNEEYTLKELGL